MYNKKHLLLLCLTITISLLALSCTSTVRMEEFTMYKSSMDQQIQSLTREIEIANREIMSLESHIKELRSENNLAKEGIRSIQEEFNTTYSQIQELVVLAGYETGDDFLNLARDIVSVNNNIKNLHEKLEILRNSMALFVNN